MAEKSLTNQPEETSSKSGKSSPGINVGEFKELLEVATHERRNLQLLVEYFEKKTTELENQKSFFEKMSSQTPNTLKKLDSLNKRFEEVKTFDIRVRDFQQICKELESNYNGQKRGLEELHLLSEHIEQKIKSLQQQRGLVEKANEDAGRLNVLIWDMDSKINKLQEENKLIKNTE